MWENLFSSDSLIEDPFPNELDQSTQLPRNLVTPKGEGSNQTNDIIAYKEWKSF